MATIETDKERFDRLDSLRKKAKVTNYSALYGVGSTKLARDMNISKKEAQNLLDTFWIMNHAVRKAASQTDIKHTGQSMWLKNPVSGFWYQLRAEKDIWSTLNQGTGVFCFDTWVYFVRRLGAVVNMQFHDEVGVITKVGEEQS